MPGDAALPPAEVERAAVLLRDRVGFEVRGHLRCRLEAALRSLMTVTGRPAHEVVEELLREDLEGRAWRILLARVTVGETYFFRDARQFEALRTAILPALLDRRRHQRLLRVWSAGCASGEELYSVAMVLHELLGRPGEWTLELLGTDIDQEALERARQGIYRAWSFRRTPQDLVARYFTEEGSLWRLRDDIRTMARFARHNLVLDPVPQEDGVPLQFDLVLCRNVLMYMPRSVREDVAARLGESLAPGGRLMVAAVELDGSLFGGLVAERLGGATVYRRPQAGASARRPRSAVPGRKLFDTSSRSSFVGGGVPRRQAGPGAGAPQAIAERTATPREAAAPARSVETAAALAARARAEADRGRPEARSIAERAVSLDPLCAEAHHVLGLLAMERGDLEGAAAHFRRALYVEPGLAPAHLAMAAVAERQGRRSAAARHRAKAVELLSRLAADAEVPGEPGVPAGWLLEMARGGGSGDGAAAEREP